MSKIFDVINENVFLTKEGELVPQFSSLKKEFKKSKDHAQVLTYIYSVYDRESPYQDVLPGDRKSMVCIDLLKESGNYWEELEKNEVVKAAIVWLTYAQTTTKERLFYGIEEKVEEYLVFWKSLTVNKENHNIVSESVANAAKLVKLRDDLEKQIFKNKEDIHEVGGGKAKLFES